ncbi:hypothetical protein HanXRQr2_Chr03g0126161 [Helianthus annuus]|uniref:Uncharacterized protein n=1 Tax=Helianthus annuus TaxID=4232 RepID=A0A9K3NX36_HELAN|nr:hypothetical protein HanXRQr2_Chr03g0126161 [Helianthus annuus]KAJ0944979.1 hypothetical protein HanPSC8_Chr03g0122801 [Helianthus annuus]
MADTEDEVDFEDETFFLIYKKNDIYIKKRLGLIYKEVTFYPICPLFKKQ